MYKSVILPLAKQDIKEAAIWCNGRQAGLGKRFTSHLRKAVHYIRQNPKTVVVRYDDIQTALLDTFSYLIHFSVDDDKKSLLSSAFCLQHAIQYSYLVIYLCGSNPF